MEALNFIETKQDGCPLDNVLMSQLGLHSSQQKIWIIAGLVKALFGLRKGNILLSRVLTPGEIALCHSTPHQTQLWRNPMPK